MTAIIIQFNGIRKLKAEGNIDPWPTYKECAKLALKEIIEEYNKELENRKKKDLWRF